MNNIEIDSKVTTTMVNDFVCKSMEFKTAHLDIKDFTYGIMMGLMERIIPNSFKIDETILNILKESRI